MHIQLRPEMRTDGGEAISIYCDQDWVGDAYLIYREGEMLKGTIQVDSVMVSKDTFSKVVDVAKQYVTDLAFALRVDDTTIVSLYGDIRTVYDDDDNNVDWDTDPTVSADDPEDYNFTLELNPDGTMVIERYRH